jgi:hypothetical protein
MPRKPFAQKYLPRGTTVLRTFECLYFGTEVHTL